MDITNQEEQQITITLANGRQVSIFAVCLGLNFKITPDSPLASQFSAQFEASYPFLVSPSESSQSTGLTSGGGGTVPPPQMPMALTSDTGGKIYIVNNGNGVYYPTARISETVTNPALKNYTTGKEIRFNITLAAGEYIEIDFKRKTVTDQTGANKYSIVSGDWWYLQPGTNEIRFLADTYNASAQATLRYRDSWLGI